MLSTEYRSRLVSSFYSTYLHRGASPSEVNAWVVALQQGNSDEAVQNGFLSSGEYYGIWGGTDASWIGSLYTNVLGRLGGPSEINAWLSQLALGATHPQIGAAIVLSSEYRGRLVASYYAKYL